MHIGSPTLPQSPAIKPLAAPKSETLDDIYTKHGVTNIVTALKQQRRDDLTPRYTPMSYTLEDFVKVKSAILEATGKSLYSADLDALTHVVDTEIVLQLINDKTNTQVADTKKTEFMTGQDKYKVYSTEYRAHFDDIFKTSVYLTPKQHKIFKLVNDKLDSILSNHGDIIKSLSNNTLLISHALDLVTEELGSAIIADTDKFKVAAALGILPHYGMSITEQIIIVTNGQLYLAPYPKSLWQKLSLNRTLNSSGLSLPQYNILMVLEHTLKNSDRLTQKELLEKLTSIREKYSTLLQHPKVCAKLHELEDKIASQNLHLLPLGIFNINPNQLTRGNLSMALDNAIKYFNDAYGIKTEDNITTFKKISSHDSGLFSLEYKYAMSVIDDIKRAYPPEVLNNEIMEKIGKLKSIDCLIKTAQIVDGQI